MLEEQHEEPYPTAQLILEEQLWYYPGQQVHSIRDSPPLNRSGKATSISTLSTSHVGKRLKNTDTFFCTQWSLQLVVQLAMELVGTFLVQSLVEVPCTETPSIY